MVEYGKRLIYIGFFFSIIGCKTEVSDHLKYLKQPKPTMVPVKFAPNVISHPEVSEFGAVFNAEGTEFYFSVDIARKPEIRYCKLEGEKWTNPITLLSHEKYGYNDPFLSPDENRLYFISKRSLDGTKMKRDHDIWYVEKTKKGWGSPKNAGSQINSEKNEYYISFTRNGKMYFSSNKNTNDDTAYNFDIYSSVFSNGEFQEAIRLDEAINTAHYEADIFVDPNEGYVIFCANRPEGLGQCDLYISFKNEDGSWTESKNMGETINTDMHELCPFVSKDGKYLFYTSNQDIYWVDAKVIDQYK